MTCGEMKSLDCFHVRSSSKDGRQGRCRECCKAWYRENAAVHKARVLARNNAERHVLRAMVTEYLLSHPCVDCGETDVRCLEFDHRPGERKSGNVTTMLWAPAPRRSIVAEIAKCDVRCANCHRRCTVERGQFWRQEVHEAAEQQLQARVAARLARL